MIFICNELNTYFLHSLMQKTYKSAQGEFFKVYHTINIRKYHKADLTFTECHTFCRFMIPNSKVNYKTLKNIIRVLCVVMVFKSKIIRKVSNL